MRRLTIRGTGLSLGLFFTVTFVLCALWGAVVPARWEPMARLWETLLPGFVWLTPVSFLLGVVETFIYGFYVAVIFVPLFNYFEDGGARREARTDVGTGDERGDAGATTPGTAMRSATR